MRKIIFRKAKKQSIIAHIKLLWQTHKVLKKTKELVEKRKSFEEESLMYTYNGKDKDDIWAVMEFFYQNLWTKESKDYCYIDDLDEWENYNFYLKYKGVYSRVTILYGIGSSCIITPLDPDELDTNKRILHLDKTEFNVLGEVYEYVR